MTLQCSIGFRSLLTAATFLLALSCSSPLAPSSAATITITPAGVSPREVRIDAWHQVTFVNEDVRPHSIVSDPINEHSQCPPINGVGYLPPGGRADTRTLTRPGVCGFHDHLNLDDDSLRGRILVD